MLVTIEQARAHCRADELDTTVALYLAAAVSAAAEWLNRRVFDDAPALAAAIASLPAELAAAQADYDAALVAAALLGGEAARAAREAACNALRMARYRADETYRGIVANDQINAAILLITGHLFNNRESVITGTIATELPQGAHSLLWPFRVGLGA